MPDSTRDKIIDTVIRLYSQYSYEAISTKQITEEVGISKGTLYWHFTKKEDMFDEAFQRCYQKMIECARDGINENASAIDCLKRRIKNLVNLNKIEPHHMKIMTKHGGPVSTSETQFSDYHDIVASDMLNHIRKGLQSKEIVDLPEIFLLQALMYINLGFLDYLNKHPECYENEALIDKMIDNLYKSIQP